MTTRIARVAALAAVLSLTLTLALVARPSPAAAKSSHHRSLRHGSHHHRARSARVLHPRKLRSLTLGVSGGADWALASGNPGTQSMWVPRAHRVGARTVRLDVTWFNVAPVNPQSGFLASDPASPGYDWTRVDEQVRELAAAHVRTVISVWGAPTWAEGSDMPGDAQVGTWKPNALAFGDFARAIATRYSGNYPDPLHPGRNLPRVRFWQGWNEPNIPHFLEPQWRQTGPHTYRPESPMIYRSLLNAFYKNVKAVSEKNFVIAAGTAPYGNPPGGPQMQPVDFDRALFCLNKKLRHQHGCNAKTYLDAIDTHPYGVGGPLWHAFNAGDVAVPDVYKLVDVLHAAERLSTVLPARKKGVWITEISWDTNPPDPHGVPIKRQARWLEQALYVLWNQGVDTVLWWQLVDSPPMPSYSTSLQGGLYLLNGQAKPAATAFRFPLVGIRRTEHNATIWGRSPAAGILKIQRRVKGHWRTLKRARVHRHQVFELPLSITGKAKIRAHIRHYTSLTWRLARRPAVPTALQIHSALRSALAVYTYDGHASFGALLRANGYRTSFRAPSAGKLLVKWFAVRTSHHHRYRVLIADARRAFTSSHRVRFKIRLTPAGRSLLEQTLNRPHRKRLRIVARGSFNPTDTRRRTASRRITLHR